MRLLTAAVLVALAAGPVLAGEGEERLYGPDGRYEGRATTDAANPRQKSLYDASGRYVGRVMSDDNGDAKVYDQHGKYVGRSSGGQVSNPKK